MGEDNVELQSGEQVEGEMKKKKEFLKLSLKKNVKPDMFNGPKRAKSAFMLYGDAVRVEATTLVKAKCEQTGEIFKAKLVMSKIGEMWKTVSDEKKKEYETKTKELAAKYGADNEAWKLTKDFKKYLQANALHKKKQADKKNLLAAKESGMPKKATMGYMAFGNDIRPEVRKELEAKGEKFSITSAAGIQKARWNALGEDGQKKYHDAYAAGKVKYAEEMKAWLDTEAGKIFARAKEHAVQKKKEDAKVGNKRGRVTKSKMKSAKRAKKEGDGKKEEDEEEDEEDDDDDDDDLDLSSAEEEDGEDEEDGEEDNAAEA